MEFSTALLTAGVLRDRGRFLSLILQPGLHGDSAGNLYGTTYRGGNVNAGLVFELDTGGNLTMLHSFMGSDGGYPTANLIADSVGNLYSTTTTDGNSNCGTVFKLATLGQTSPTLHSFSCQPDGSIPKAGLLPATRTGNLYGTTSGGGTSNFGTVFEVNANTGMEAVLYSFTGGADGATPVGGLITDQAGNLYGTTTAGGNGNNGAGDGVVFKLNIAMRQETVLHTFVALMVRTPPLLWSGIQIETFTAQPKTVVPTAWGPHSSWGRPAR